MARLSASDADINDLKDLLEELIRAQDSMARENTRLWNQNTALELAVKDAVGRLDNVTVHSQLLLRQLVGFSERNTQLLSGVVTALGQFGAPDQRVTESIAQPLNSDSPSIERTGRRR